MNLGLFKEKITEFLLFLNVEKHASEHTQRAYQADLEQVVTFWSGLEKKQPLPIPIDAVLKRYIVALFYKKITKSSLARKCSSIRSFQNFLQQQGINLALDIKSPKLDKKLPATLTVDEIFYLLDTIKPEELPTKYPERDQAVFELMYATGVRCSELINIKLNDIDVSARKIRVLGKGKKERFVLFGSKAAERLKKYIQAERHALVGSQYDDGHLFLNRNGTQITTRSIQRIFEMFRKFLQIERKLTPHKIRHSFATHLLQQGVNLRIIQELLGHKTINSTEIYTHVSNQQLAKMCDEKHPLSRLDHVSVAREKK